MATLVLQTVGAALGNALGGPIGGAIGQAVGATAGSYIDQSLFGADDRVVSGPRLGNSQFLSSHDGAPIPRTFGTNRISGEIIWATRFEEVRRTSSSSQGGKGGGPKTTVETFAYYANFALALCEGEIGGVARIWVDGELLDRTKHTIRVYRGTNEQFPDSLIEAKQGEANAPAYRGIAYLVFENFPIEGYGNRIPQISVEVVRPIGGVERNIKAVNLIPGASEFAYETTAIQERLSPTSRRYLNVNQTLAETDFIASLDALQAVCPNLEQVSLVVAWFGDDLRAGNCTLRPKVEVANRDQTSGVAWSVGNLTRASATLVSTFDGKPALGGTPSDNSVLNAIAELKARGLRVSLSPFVLMDIPPENAQQQPAYPWRGRVTCSPPRGEFESANGTVSARQQLNSFVGSVTPNDIQISNGRLDDSGLNEWSFRRLILHYARLAELSGGVDMFLLGSEFPGLTSVQDENGQFPFVEALIELSNDVRLIVGRECLITYGANWTEYFGFQPQDGSEDVYFNLDPLWAAPNIDVVGIDNYMPLSDFRHEAGADQPSRAPNDSVELYKNIASGEGYDWYYVSGEDRLNGVRTPITDGLGEPWIFRYKDIRSWWNNQHYERIDGVRSPISTDWVPQSKPIIFTEIGCPAVHCGANQPNVFVDPKSIESELPYHSNGARDDGAMFAFLEAHQTYWDSANATENPLNNPQSTLYDGRMVDESRSHVWAWDARPYPSFPNMKTVWSDGANWTTGHWLNGRLGTLRLKDLIRHLAAVSGVESVDVSGVYENISGFVLAEVTTARAELETLVQLFNIAVREQSGVLVFRSCGFDQPTPIDMASIAVPQNSPVLSWHQEQEADLPTEISLDHIDPETDYRAVATNFLRNDITLPQRTYFSTSIAISPNSARPVLENWLQMRWQGRDTVSFALPNSMLDLAVGDIVTLKGADDDRNWEVSSAEQGTTISITARSVERAPILPSIGASSSIEPELHSKVSAPLVEILDLPLLPQSNGGAGNYIAATVRPWKGALGVYSSFDEGAFVLRQMLLEPATMGELAEPLAGSTVTSRWSNEQKLLLNVYDEALFSVSALQLFSGANAIAVQTNAGSWEILQFKQAAQVSPNTWQISNFIRGQRGTELEAVIGCETGARFVFLNNAVKELEVSADQLGLQQNWSIGPVGGILGDDTFTTKQHVSKYIGLRPFKPVHLKAKFNGDGDLQISWVRRDRLFSDNWELAQIPQSEERLEYEVQINNGGDASLRLIVSTENVLIPRTALSEEFGLTLASLTVEVRQTSATAGNGPPAHKTINFN